MSALPHRSSPIRPRSCVVAALLLSLAVAPSGAAWADAPNRQVPAAAPAVAAPHAADPTPPAVPVAPTAPISPAGGAVPNAPTVPTPPVAVPAAAPSVPAPATVMSPAVAPGSAAKTSPNAAANANAPLAAGGKSVAVGSSLGTLDAVARRGNVRVASFAHAKSYLRILYDERPRTLYSDCPFDRARQVDYGQCTFKPRFGGKRAHRVEWEHVVPAEAFGHSFSAWRVGHPNCVDSGGRHFRGRRCAQRASAAYRLIEADLYNLYPEIGELNQLRSNKPMGEPRQKRREVMPPSATFIGSDAFAPRPAVRGDVARTYRYMNEAYPGRSLLSRTREDELATWNDADPVDAWECRRAWRIEAIQGNENRFVKAPCLEAGLWPSG